MADVKWIKIMVDIFDDEKIFLIEQLPEADSIVVIWFKLLCLAGKQNNKGVFTLCATMPFTDEMFAAVFRRPLNTVRLALSTFQKFGMVEIINGTVTIPNWGKHQNIESMERRQEYMRNYMNEYRQEQKKLAEGKQPRKCLRKQNVSAPDIDVDIDIEGEKKESVKGAKAPARPTLDDVVAYCKERGNQVDAQRWFDYYSSNGWRVGKNPMKEWKAAVRTWEKNGYDTPKITARPSKEVGAHRYDQRQYTESQLDAGTSDLVAEALRARNG